MWEMAGRFRRLLRMSSHFTPRTWSIWRTLTHRVCIFPTDEKQGVWVTFLTEFAFVWGEVLVAEAWLSGSDRFL